MKDEKTEEPVVAEAKEPNPVEIDKEVKKHLEEAERNKMLNA